MLTWVEVDLGAIKKNIERIKKYIGPKVDIAAVIKSNAYGHGLIEIAQVVSKTGVKFLCVDNIFEARAIKNSPYQLKPNILILGGVESEDLPWVIRNNIHFGIYDLVFAKKAQNLAKKLKRKGKAHIKIDTGMHRLGFNIEDAIDSIIEIQKNYHHIEIEGLWSHFADSGSERSEKYTLGQIQKFSELIERLKRNRIKIRYEHLCNSSGVVAFPEAYFNLVRPGILIYGIFPSDYIKKNYQRRLKIEPALNFKTRIVALRDLPKGERIGYGLTHRLKKNSKIAVLPVGYKDGYGRDLSNKGEVIIKNIKCRVLGRICMRMMMVDVSSVRGVKLDDEVILLGGDGHAKIEADEVAEKMDTIPYEVLSRISESVPRTYKN